MGEFCWDHHGSGGRERKDQGLNLERFIIGTSGRREEEVTETEKELPERQEETQGSTVSQKAQKCIHQGERVTSCAKCGFAEEKNSYRSIGFNNLESRCGSFCVIASIFSGKEEAKLWRRK